MKHMTNLFKGMLFITTLFCFMSAKADSDFDSFMQKLKADSDAQFQRDWDRRERAYDRATDMDYIQTMQQIRRDEPISGTINGQPATFYPN